MKELVFIRGQKPFTNSLVIAEGTENEHRSIIRLVQKYVDRLERWGKVRFTDLKSTNPLGGRPTVIAELNEQQATFLVTLLKNNDVVLDFKSELVDQFYKMREILLERKSAEYLEARNSSKITFKKLTDTLQEILIPLAREQGSKAEDKIFYINYAKMMNKCAGINAKSRDILPLEQLFEVSKMQEIAVISIKNLASRKDDYHQIYRNTKQTLEHYAQLSFITQRFLIE